MEYYSNCGSEAFSAANTMLPRCSTIAICHTAKPILGPRADFKKYGGPFCKIFGGHGAPHRGAAGARIPPVQGEEFSLINVIVIGSPN
jgi:hypothetical protein